MAKHTQASFAAGELDPSLHERVTFDKYQSGLKTARNVIIGKTGRVISRFGTKYEFQPKYNDRKHVIYIPPYSQTMLEWGHLYFRFHNLETGAVYEDSHAYTEDHLTEHIHFTSTKTGIYVFLKRRDAFDPYSANSYEKFYLLTTIPGFEFKTQTGTIYEVPTPLELTSGSIGGTGYGIDYAFSLVCNGSETTASILLNATTVAKAITAVSEKNVLSFRIAKAGFTSWANLSELRCYRRPKDGGAFGFIGSTGNFTTTDPTYVTISFTDIGQGADYTVSPHNYYEDFVRSQSDVVQSYGQSPQWAFAGYRARTGIIFQQRLCVVDDFQNAIGASRIGIPRSFTRDFPLNSSCGLLFKTAGEGNAKILRLLDAGALAAFTTEGVFSNDPGPLIPSNIALSKRGEWVIDEKLPPLIIPGAIIFFDILSNSVIAMNYSYENSSFVGDEVSVFSNHLIQNNKIVSWAYLDGRIPVVLAVRDDGKMLCFSFQKQQELKAWTWFDTDGKFENVVVRKMTDGTSKAYVSVLRNGVRTIESFAPRFAVGLKDLVLMDSTVTFNSQVGSASTINVIPTNPENWEGELLLEADRSTFANTAGNGKIGSKFKFFDNQGSGIILEVTQYISDQRVKVTPEEEFPSDQASSIKLYKTYKTLTGLDHLNGKLVSIMVDGYVISSPLNDVEDYPDILVQNGSVTLPGDTIGAFVHVGLPFAADTETLDIDTVEQQPALVEADLVNRMYLKVYNSRGLYIGSSFPVNDRVKGDELGEQGLEDLEEREEDISLGNIGNAAQESYTKRYTKVIPNDWASKGRVCIRQVDPLPFEILSIIPDLTVLREQGN